MYVSEYDWIEDTRTACNTGTTSKQNQERQSPKRLIKEITMSCNPVSPPVATFNCLVNIATGKAATKETEEYLTRCLVVGHDHDLQVKF